MGPGARQDPSSLDKYIKLQQNYSLVTCRSLACVYRDTSHCYQAKLCTVIPVHLFGMLHF